MSWIISEYPPDQPSYPARFLERNRLISGLCATTIVIEAGFKSGALATARNAFRQNRTVYALPGDITRPQAQGCLQLLTKGAQPITGIDAILKLIGFQPRAKAKLALSPEETLVLQALAEKPVTTQELMEKTLFPIQKMNVVLSQLELKRAIKKNRAFLWEAA